MNSRDGPRNLYDDLFTADHNVAMGIDIGIDLAIYAPLFHLASKVDINLAADFQSRY